MQFSDFSFQIKKVWVYKNLEIYNISIIWLLCPIVSVCVIREMFFFSEVRQFGPAGTQRLRIPF